jgi:hypothetical protein
MVWTCDQNLVEYEWGDSKLDVKMGPVCENVNLIQSLVSDYVSNECLVSVSRHFVITKITVLWIITNILEELQQSSPILRTEATGCSKILVMIYQTTWRHSPENSNIYGHCHQNLKSHR